VRRTVPAGIGEAVLGIGRSLGLEVVAGGVETAEDPAALEPLGCPCVQGYHLGRPMPHGAVVETPLAPRREAA
jgi:diguanylate cyclase